MTGTTTHPVLESDAADLAAAFALIDQSLGSLAHRELVSAAEVADLLLDVRSLLSAIPGAN